KYLFDELTPFCWMESFDTGKKIDASSLTKIRHKLGPKFVRDLEEKTYRVLIDKKMQKSDVVICTSEFRTVEK
ncbi:MAG: hypothetical protein ABH952_07645, partial [Candidatus Omnitrophota bacterium]